MTRIESWKEVTKQRDDAQLFEKAIKNLGIIMGVTGMCLFLQFIVLLLDFIAGSVHATISNVRADLPHIHAHLSELKYKLIHGLINYRGCSLDAGCSGILALILFLRSYHRCC